MRFPFVFALFLPAVLVAQDPEPRPARRAEPPPNRYVKGSFGIDFTNQYFFRGILQENQGIIAQPWFEFGYDLYEDDEGAVRDVDLTFGLWNSLHDGPTGSTGGIWYESDFYTDVAVGVGEQWTLNTRYTAYTSPNGSFETVQELAFGARLDDKKEPLFGVIDGGLRPHFLIAFELDGQRDAGNDNGIYAEVGLEPRFVLMEGGSLELTLAVPVTLGLSLMDYYEQIGGGDDSPFGYFDVGGELSTHMKFLPERMGRWDAMLGLHWLMMCDNLEDRNAGDTTELILSLGVATTF